MLSAVSISIIRIMWHDELCGHQQWYHTNALDTIFKPAFNDWMVAAFHS